MPRPRLFPHAYALLYALVGLAIHLAWYPIGNVGVESDFYGDTAPAAVRLARGHLSVTDYPFRGPLQAILLVAIRPLAGDWYRSGVVLNLACAAATLLLAHHLLRRLYGKTIATAAVVALSLLYPFFVDAHKATSDHLFLLLVLASTGFLLFPGGPRRALGGGALAALAFLCRYNGIFLLPAAALVYLAVDPERRPRRHRLRDLGAWCAGFAVVAAPWIALSIRQTGELLWTRNFQSIGIAFYGSGSELRLPGLEFDSLTALVADDPGRFLRRYLGKLVEHRMLDLRRLLGPAAGLLVLAGTARLAFHLPSRRQTAFYVVAATYALLMALWFWLPRFFLFPAVAYLALGFSAVSRAEGTRESRAARWILGRLPIRAASPSRLRVRAGAVAPAIALAAVVALGLGQIVFLERIYLADRPLELLDAAAALRRLAPGAGAAPGRPPAVLARRPHLAFLAGMEHVRFPDEAVGYDSLLAYAEDRGADYLVLGPGELAAHPELRRLATLPRLPQLATVHRGPGITVYRMPDRVDRSAIRRAGGGAGPVR